jgi:predicted nucleic acid-binding protein
MSGVLLDTDVLIDHIHGHRRIEMDGPMKSFISVVTRAELFAGREREEPTVEALLKRFSEIDLTPDIAKRAGRIRRTTHLDIADALIAATALEHKLSLMTRNRRHFERVPGLTLRTPEDQTKPTPSTPPGDLPQGDTEPA